MRKDANSMVAKNKAPPLRQSAGVFIPFFIPYFQALLGVRRSSGDSLGIFLDQHLPAADRPAPRCMAPGTRGHETKQKKPNTDYQAARQVRNKL